MNHVRIGAVVLAISACVVASACGAAKPCPVVLESQYEAALLTACKGSPSLAECPQFPAIKAAHEAEQEDAGCRVKP